MKHVLVIDDDPAVVELLRSMFDKEGFIVSGCQDANSSLECFKKSNPDIILLDLILSGMDGFDVCREIRKISDTPIIMLTTRGDVLDKVVGLELGADDYLQKPFEPKELLARIKAVLRRCDICKDRNSGTLENDRGPEIVEYSGLRVDKTRYIVIAEGNKIDMPPKELELLFFLATHPNRVFTREQLLGNVWGYDFFGESRTVDVHVKRIREKLDAISDKHDWKLRTVWGVGYKFEVSDSN